MISDSAKIEGLEASIREMKALNAEMVVEVKKLNLEAAELVAKNARERAPRRSGDLAGTVRAGATIRSGVVRAGGSKLKYAGPIHFGWAAHNIAPQPFLYEALDSRRGAVLASYERGVKKIARKHGGG